jgi:hypothetical protein
MSTSLSGAPERGTRVSVEMLLGVSASFLSLCALVVALLQTRIAREQQYAAVWPYLEIGSGRIDGKFTLQLENKGVGPAVVKSVELKHRGQVAPSYVSVFNAALERFTGPRFYAIVRPGSVLKPGEELLLFEIDKDPVNAARLDALVADPGFALRIVYADVYGNCWVTTTAAVEPAACPR